MTEPVDVGPLVGGDLSVTPADREHVVGLLNAAFAEGHLTVADRDNRIRHAQEAQTFDDLIPLTRDLLDIQPANPAAGPLPAGTAPAAAPQPVGTAPAAAPQPAGAVDSITAMFGGVSRSGQWQVRPRTSVSAVFGGVDLDFTKAQLQSNNLDINVLGLFGGINMIVPHGTAVYSSVTPIFGGVDSKHLSAPALGGLTINLHGLALFGGVSIRHPRSPWA
ncbi:MAG: DUF1707 domain-containing protein [Propionibacteriaceae bacterium]|jgi:hypothetical protein|nr:DUF1707 domain-containing protein [Propionibacteriaceae bacterium]